MEKKTLFRTLTWFHRHRDSHDYYMTALYPFFGITRQGAFAAWQRQDSRTTQIGLLAELTHCIRADHPRMGLRKIYAMLAPLPIGRDAFVKAMAAHGLMLERHSQPWVTTPRPISSLVPESALRSGRA